MRALLGSRVFATGVLSRMLRLGAVALLVIALTALVRNCINEMPPGEFATRKGDILLSDGKYQQALARFDEALQRAPGYPGATMGKAIALMQLGRAGEADATLSTLIESLRAGPDTPNTRRTLAAALGNRGILADREGRYEAALADYQAALAVDANAVSGPGLVDRILSGRTRPSNIERRRRYLEEQLALPEDQRRLRDPEADAQQSMWKP